MIKFFENILVQKLHEELIKYVKHFSQDNVKVSVGLMNTLTIQNLELIEEIFIQEGIPIMITNSTIKEIQIEYSALKKNDIQLTISGINLNLRSLSEIYTYFDIKYKHSMFDDIKIGDSRQNYKKQKLKKWEDDKRKYFKELNPPSFADNFLLGMIGKIVIKINDCTIKYLNQSISNQKIMCELFIKSIIIQNKQQDQLNTQNIMSKQIIVENMSLQIYKAYVFRPNIFKINLKQFEDQDKNFQFLKQNQFDYDSHLINPFNFQIDLEIEKFSTSSKPQISININIEQTVILSVNEWQKDFLINLGEHLKQQDQIIQNYHNRPNIHISKSYSLWWIYIIDQIIERQKSFHLDQNQINHKLHLKEIYIHLYKMKQNILPVQKQKDWTDDEQLQFEICEQQLRVKDLLKYREIAFQQIISQSKKELDLNQINNLPNNQFQENQKKQTENEQDQINKSLELNFNINQILILLMQYKNEENISFNPNNMKIYEKCKCAKCTNNIPNEFLMLDQIDQKLNDQIKDEEDYGSVSSNDSDDKNKYIIDKQLQFSKVGVTNIQKSSRQNSQKDSKIQIQLSDTMHLKEGQKLDDQDQNLQKKKSSKSRLILMIILRCINGTIQQIDDKYLQTPNIQNKHQPLIIKDIQILSPFCFKRYLGKGENSYINNYYSLICNFVVQDKDILVIFIRYLKKHGYKQYAAFLSLYNRDQQNQNFDSLQFYNDYYNFLNHNDSDSFLHMDNNLAKEFIQLTLLSGELDKIKIKRCLNEMIAHVQEILKRSILPHFLEENGEQVLTSLSNTTEFYILANQSIKQKSTFSLIFQEKQNIYFKEKDIDNIYDEYQQFQYQNSEKNILINCQCQAIKIYLSDRSLYYLLFFMETQIKAPPNVYELFKGSHYKIHKCITKFNQKKIEKQIEKQKIDIIDFNINLSLLKIKFYDETLFSKQLGKLVFSFSNIQIKSQKYDELMQLASIISQHDKKIFERKIALSNCILINLESISLRCEEMEYIFNKSVKEKIKPYKKKPKSDQNIFSTCSTILIFKSILENNPYACDMKLLILFPYFNFQINDRMFPFFAFVGIMNNFNEKINNLKQENEDKKMKDKNRIQDCYSPQQVWNIAQKSVHQDRQILNDLKNIYKDHNLFEQKQYIKEFQCRHCQIIFKKSIQILHIIIGNFSKLQRLKGTLFDIVNILNNNNNTNDQGIKINIEIYNDQQTKQDIFTLKQNFILISRDLGFFKDNLTIHCSVSQEKKEICSLILQPNLHASQNFIQELDDDHFQYCKYIDQIIFQYYTDNNLYQRKNNSSINNITIQSQNQTFQKNKSMNLGKVTSKSQGKIRQISPSSSSNTLNLNKQFNDKNQQSQSNIFILLVQKKNQNQYILQISDINQKIEQQQMNYTHYLFFSFQKIDLKLIKYEYSSRFITSLINIQMYIEKFKQIYKSIYIVKQNEKFEQKDIGYSKKLKAIDKIFEQKVFVTIDKFNVNIQLIQQKSINLCMNEFQINLNMNNSQNLDLFKVNNQKQQNLDVQFQQKRQKNSIKIPIQNILSIRSLEMQIMNNGYQDQTHLILETIKIEKRIERNSQLFQIKLDVENVEMNFLSIQNDQLQIFQCPYNQEELNQSSQKKDKKLAIDIKFQNQFKDIYVIVNHSNLILNNQNISQIISVLVDLLSGIKSNLQLYKKMMNDQFYEYDDRDWGLQNSKKKAIQNQVQNRMQINQSFWFNFSLKIQSVQIEFKKDLKVFGLILFIEPNIESKHSGDLICKELNMNIKDINYKPNPWEGSEIDSYVENQYNNLIIKEVQKEKDAEESLITIKKSQIDQIWLIVIKKINIYFLNVYVQEIIDFMEDIAKIVDILNEPKTSQNKRDNLDSNVSSNNDIIKQKKNLDENQQTKINVNLNKSNLIIPKGSQSLEAIKLDLKDLIFKNYSDEKNLLTKEVNQTKKLFDSFIEINQPNINDDNLVLLEQNQNLIVDNDNNLDDQNDKILIRSINQYIQINQVQLSHNLQFKDKNDIINYKQQFELLLDLDQVDIIIQQPQKLYQFDNSCLEFKGKNIINIKNMKSLKEIDLGKLFKIQEIVDQNLAENTLPTKNEKKSIEKLNLEINVNQFSLNMELYSEQNKNEIDDNQNNQQSKSTKRDQNQFDNNLILELINNENQNIQNNQNNENIIFDDQDDYLLQVEAENQDNLQLVNQQEDKQFTVFQQKQQQEDDDNIFE